MRRSKSCDSETASSLSRVIRSEQQLCFQVKMAFVLTWYVVLGWESPHAQGLGAQCTSPLWLRLNPNSAAWWDLALWVTFPNREWVEMCSWDDTGWMGMAEGVGISTSKVGAQFGITSAWVSSNFYMYMQSLFEPVHTLSVHIHGIINVLKSVTDTNLECQTFWEISVLKIPLAGC